MTRFVPETAIFDGIDDCLEAFPEAAIVPMVVEYDHDKLIAVLKKKTALIKMLTNANSKLIEIIQIESTRRSDIL